MVDTFCDVCEKEHAVVKLNGTKLCDDCAAEEGIEVL
jgi:hypothetical protein